GLTENSVDASADGLEVVAPAIDVLGDGLAAELGNVNVALKNKVDERLEASEDKPTDGLEVVAPAIDVLGDGLASILDGVVAGGLA
ncbi:hypothetical protein J3B02_005511, partial [Coemansia erecta]